jgi:hypothetical protein
LERENDLRRRPRLAPRPRGDGDHVADRGSDRLDRLARPAGLLNRQSAESVGLLKPVFLLHAADLKDLTAQSHHDDTGKIGVARVAPLGPAQDVETLACRRVTAPGAVHDRDDAVDFGMAFENARALDLGGGEAGDRCGAVHGRQDPEIVARAGPAIAALVALEGGAQLGREEVVVAHVLAEPVVALEIVQTDIVLMHPLAGRDVRLRKTDDLPEFADGLAFPDRLDRHLVAAQDTIAGRQAGGGGSLRDEIDGDDDVVVVVETDRARCCGHD